MLELRIHAVTLSLLITLLASTASAQSSPANEALWAAARAGDTAAVARALAAGAGVNAAGTADGQGAVASWDAASGQNVRWKTPIPGLGVSSPIVVGSRVFVTTAVRRAATPKSAPACTVTTMPGAASASM